MLNSGFGDLFVLLDKIKCDSYKSKIDKHSETAVVISQSCETKISSIGIYTPWEDSESDYLTAFDNYFSQLSDPRMNLVYEKLSKIDEITNNDLVYFRTEFQI